MSYDPTAIDLLAHQVLNCVCVELDRVATEATDIDQPGCPCRAFVAPGLEIAWDNCCSGCDDSTTHGQLAVAVESVFPTTRFPLEDRSLDLCAPYTIAVGFVVAVHRCTPVIDDKGRAPSADALSANARIITTDMLTMMHAVTCCVTRTPTGKRRRVAVTSHRTVGPRGGCAGSELRFVADLGLMCQCPPEGS